jgi:hypothetical protein
LQRTCIFPRYFLNPFLEYEKTGDETTNGPEWEEEYYEKPDLSGEIRVDFNILYGVEDEEAETEIEPET